MEILVMLRNNLGLIFVAFKGKSDQKRIQAKIATPAVKYNIKMAADTQGGMLATPDCK